MSMKSNALPEEFENLKKECGDVLTRYKNIIIRFDNDLKELKTTEHPTQTEISLRKINGRKLSDFFYDLNEEAIRNNENRERLDKLFYFNPSKKKDTPVIEQELSALSPFNTVASQLFSDLSIAEDTKINEALSDVYSPKSQPIIFKNCVFKNAFSIATDEGTLSLNASLRFENVIFKGGVSLENIDGNGHSIVFDRCTFESEIDFINLKNLSIEITNSKLEYTPNTKQSSFNSYVFDAKQVRQRHMPETYPSPNPDKMVSNNPKTNEELEKFYKLKDECEEVILECKEIVKQFHKNVERLPMVSHPDKSENKLYEIESQSIKDLFLEIQNTIDAHDAKDKLDKLFNYKIYDDDILSAMSGNIWPVPPDISILDEEIDDLKFANHIAFSNLYIEGDLALGEELSYWYDDLCFEKVVFDGKLVITGPSSNIYGSIIFYSIHFRASVFLRDINFQDNISFGSCTFKGSLFLDSLKCKDYTNGQVSITASTILLLNLTQSHITTFECTLSVVNSLYCTDNEIMENLTIKENNLITAGKLDCNSASIDIDTALFLENMGISLFLQNIVEDSNLYFNKTIVYNGLDFKYNQLGKSDMYSEKDTIRFNLKCYGTADFWNTKFPLNIDWNGSEFNGKANFKNVEFEKSTNFNECIFASEIDFSKAIFQQGADFRGSTFKGEAKFNNAKFKNTTEFSSCTFDRPPKFHNAKMHKDTTFSQSKFDACLDKFRQEYDHDTADDYARAFMTLRQHMSNLANDIETTRFFKYEQKVHQFKYWYDGKTLNWFISVMYEAISQFGNSTLRPVILWVITWFFFACIFSDNMVDFNHNMLVQDEHKNNYPIWVESVWMGFAYSSQSITNPLSIFSTDVPFYPKNGWVAFWAHVESIIGVTILTLWIFAVRRRFQKGE